jgi:hypothetical protein
MRTEAARVLAHWCRLSRELLGLHEATLASRCGLDLGLLGLRLWLGLRRLRSLRLFGLRRVGLAVDFELASGEQPLDHHLLCGERLFFQLRGEVDSLLHSGRLLAKNLLVEPCACGFRCPNIVADFQLGPRARAKPRARPPLGSRRWVIECKPCCKLCRQWSRHCEISTPHSTTSSKLASTRSARKLLRPLGDAWQPACAPRACGHCVRAALIRVNPLLGAVCITDPHTQLRCHPEDLLPRRRMSRGRRISGTDCKRSRRLAATSSGAISKRGSPCTRRSLTRSWSVSVSSSTDGNGLP